MKASGNDLEAVAKILAGDALRAVGSYGEDERKLQYLRDDIAESYSESEINSVIDEYVLTGIGQAYLEGVFHAGRLDCTILGFEEAVMFHFVTNGTSGRFVSVDRIDDIDLDEFISACKAAIER